MSQSTVWQRVKTGGKTGFDKTWKALDKLGAPVNKLTNKLGSEAFWPTTLDKESDKAARILKSFCKDGFYAEEDFQPADGPKQKQKVIQKIPEKVIRNAKGLAIFTTMRTGLWVSGAGGSGILVARKPDGTWSPPSGILLHTAGLGFLVGVDIYDCVVVINSEDALEAFTKVRCTLGSEISVSAGPVGAGGVLETEIHKRQSPIYTYLKSRGFYAGVQIDGTIVIERSDENERFYGHKLPVKDILAGKVRHPPYEVKRLMETIKAAQGDSDFDAGMIPTEAPPGDYEIEDGHLFGIPEKDDPDPYGVLALEKEGLSLKEAGTQKRASWEEFSFNPSPSSPLHSIYARQSQDISARSTSRRNSWRSSAFTNELKTPSSLRNSTDLTRSSVIMSDSSTQTDFPGELPLSPARRNSIRSGDSQHSSRGSLSHPYSMRDVPEDDILKSDLEQREPVSMSTSNGYTTPPRTPPATDETPRNRPALEHTIDQHLDQDVVHDTYHDDDYEDDVHIIEEPVVQSIHTVQPAASQVVTKARMVTVPKRLPPKLPPRNPGRNGPVIIDASPKDASSEKSNSLELPRDELPSAGSSKQDVVSADSSELHNLNGPSQHGTAEPETEIALEPVATKLNEVKLDDDEQEEDEEDNVLRPDPWAKVEETRRQGQGAEKDEGNTKMPGGFD